MLFARGLRGVHFGLHVGYISESIEIGLVGGFSILIDSLGEFALFALVGGRTEGVMAASIFDGDFDADVDDEIFMVACAST